MSGYSGVCFEIKFSDRHRGFDGVLFPVRMGSGEGAVPFPRKFFLGFCMEIMHFDAFLHK